MKWEAMKAAVRRAAERELDLKISDKPFDDPQIMGSPYDVRVEGTYLGWAGKERCDELRRIYAETPSRLRRGPGPQRVSMGDIAERVGLLLRRCREAEADVTMGDPKNTVDSVMQLRRQIEMLHERVLLLEQEERAVG